ncbi:uncharacterized protein LOC110875395 [Helianthus annuus]|uniref:uncharacterized protein LOC110875395 n=1 Tax=Helianthus annuus TaxID=4232 RepID=UPI000B905464|nr:uncharacterized protein LOC110875395 [Helianthus annuus]
MNCLSINIRGVGVCGKSSWIKKLKNDFGISFIGMQESMVSDVQSALVSSYWGGSGFEFEFVNANGNSGGLVSIWDPKVFMKDLVTKDSNYLHVGGYGSGWLSETKFVECLCPTNKCRQKIVFGDFNGVRDQEERKNSFFDPVCNRDFNDFIDEAGLREYNLKGLRYTYMSNRIGLCTWSRIDRFLVCENVFNKWPNRNLSDHSPLVFSVFDSNFGPKPFRMFDSWLDRPGCVNVVTSVFDSWINIGAADSNLLNKLKKLRGCLRDWFKTYSAKEHEDKARLRKEKEELEVQMELKDLDEADLWIWSECKKAIEDIEVHKARDLRQKSRVIDTLLCGRSTFSSSL